MSIIPVVWLLSLFPSLLTTSCMRVGVNGCSRTLAEQPQLFSVTTTLLLILFFIVTTPSPLTSLLLSACFLLFSWECHPRLDIFRSPVLTQGSVYRWETGRGTPGHLFKGGSVKKETTYSKLAKVIVWHNYQRLVGVLTCWSETYSAVQVKLHKMCKTVIRLLNFSFFFQLWISTHGIVFDNIQFHFDISADWILQLLWLCRRTIEKCVFKLKWNSELFPSTDCCPIRRHCRFSVV